jgi:hypothetical protein
MSVLETSSGWVQRVTPSLKTSPEGISSGSSNFSILFSERKGLSSESQKTEIRKTLLSKKPDKKTLSLIRKTL